MQILKPLRHSWFISSYVTYPIQKYNPEGRYKILAISKEGTLYKTSLTYDQLNLLGAV